METLGETNSFLFNFLIFLFQVSPQYIFIFVSFHISQSLAEKIEFLTSFYRKILERKKNYR